MMTQTPINIRIETIKSFDSLLCEFGQTYPSNFCERMTNIMISMYMFNREINGIDIRHQICHIISDAYGNFHLANNIRIELKLLRDLIFNSMR